ncbi:MAG: hypothetical protein MSC48_02430 [Spirochaetia bacterium]|nr:hypothetical protein [Spirochaetia bacterium]
MKCNVFGKKVLFAAAAVIMSAFVLASCSDGSDDDTLSSGTGLGLGSLDKTDPIESLVTEDTVRVVDFRKVGTGNEAKDAFDFANWDSVSGMQEPIGKYTADGLELNVKNSWDGAYKLGVNSIDLSAVKKVTVVYKVEEGFTYSDPKNNKMNVMFVSADSGEPDYTATEVNLIDFAAETPSTTWKTETLDNIYAKDREGSGCTAANMTSIKAIMLNTMSGVGKLTVMGIVLSK